MMRTRWMLSVESSSRGFTLIELLVVVAIIGILATVAFPNFSSALIRAKVSRAKNDLKTLDTALEMYYMDNGNYPYVQDKGGVEWQMPAGFPAGHTNGPAGLTTPISYLHRALRDPFLLEQGDWGNEGNPLLYYERCGFGYDFTGTFAEVKLVRVPVDANGTLLGTAPDYEESDCSKVPTRWVVYSVGPDQTHRVLNPDGTVLVRSRYSILNRYDPTNGTISQGNILRFPGGLSFP
ncbi:MAG TPA: prepilin-type N-terminal cleavage/methylation domain-containing protein, partial [bacterium]|nr:prepilin-type N-terminal cleavage/methylation domain-containing protein [bacterium]